MRKLLLYRKNKNGEEIYFIWRKNISNVEESANKGTKRVCIDTVGDKFYHELNKRFQIAIIKAMRCEGGSKKPKFAATNC